MNRNRMIFDQPLNKETLLKLAERLARCIDKGQLANYEEELEKLSWRIDADEVIIAVLGQFKRGKSTLINYLIGDDILPTGVLPITSIVTKLRYGSVKRAILVLENGDKKDVLLSELISYISEQHNPENVKGVKEVLIYYPSDFLKQGITLVDTPGVGSIYRHNTDAAYDYLKHADAAIFMISADTPVNDIEIGFLRHVKKYVKKSILF